MPELPEVETIVRDLAPRLQGRSVHHPRLFKTDVLRGVSRRRLLGTLERNRITTVFRRAKHIVIHLASDHRVVIQPRMTGSLVAYDRRLTAEEQRHTVLRVGIGRGGALVYRDIRRLGTIHLLDDAAWEAYTARIGPEPLDPRFTIQRFAKVLDGTQQAIKKTIMDQRRIAGIGNIYANEILFRARLDPSRPAGSLSNTDVARLHRAIRSVLRRAIDARGSTVRNYRTGTGGAGSYQLVLRVYGRAGERCRRCGTRLAGTHAIDGRATVFCWRCQQPSTTR